MRGPDSAKLERAGKAPCGSVVIFICSLHFQELSLNSQKLSTSGGDDFPLKGIILHNGENHWADDSMTQFFPGGVVPTSYGPVEALLQKLSRLEHHQVQELQSEIDQLDGVNLHKLCHHVLIKTFNENVFRALGQSSIAISKMNTNIIGDYFDLLVKVYESGQIGEHLYETVTASLIRNFSDDAGNCLLFTLASAISSADGYRKETYFPEGDSIDNEMAIHLSKILESGILSGNEFEQISHGLKLIVLPKTLSAFVQSKVDADSIDYVRTFISVLFHDDKLPLFYLQVFRDILGDDLVADACIRSLSAPQSLKTVGELSLAMGESAFHTPEVLSSIQWNPDNDRQPSYIEQFRNFGFNEKKFPILADFFCKNFDKALRYFGDDTSNMGFVKDAISLSIRVGQSDKALEAVIRNLAMNAGMDRQAPLDEIIEVTCKLGYALSHHKMPAKRSYDLLVGVLARVGIGELHKIYPGAPARLVMDVIDQSKVAVPGRKLAAMFPQARGQILENELGI